MKRQNPQKTLLRPAGNGRVAVVLAIAVFAFLFLCAPVYAQNVIIKKHQGRTKAVSVNFRVGKAVLNTDYMGNAESFVMLDSMLAAYAPFVDSVLTVSAASPEGSYTSNESLATRRANSIFDYVIARHPELSSRIRTVAIPEAWDELRDLVSEDYYLSDSEKEKVLDIIDGPLAPDAKEARLRRLPSWKHIFRDLYPELRFSSVVVVFTLTEEEIQYAQTRKVIDIEMAPGPRLIVSQPERIPLVMPVPYQPDDRPILAVKSNLLYDLAITPNISVEFPFKDEHFSAGLNYTFPWWVWNKNATAWEILHWEGFGRYWFGNRDRRRVLSGFYAGLLAGGGYYDIEPEHKGYQGEFIDLGLEAGYAWALGRNWRLELGAGAGWMGTQYRYYVGYDSDKHLIWQHNGKFSWFGPLKASLALSYVFYHKKREGRL